MDSLAQSVDVFDPTSLNGPALEAIYAVAYGFLDIERVDDALRAFRVMVRFAPTDERGWLGLGACHERLGQEDISSELYGAGSVVAEPPSPRCLVALARIAREAGERVAALEHIERALSLCDAVGDDSLAEAIRQEWRGR